MKLFKESKHQPIKFRNFKYIGVAKDYPNICYYFKELPRDNFEIMTCALEGTQSKPEIGAGSTIKVIDVFMANYLSNYKKNVDYVNNEFIKKSIEKSFSDLKDEDKKDMIKKFTSAIPAEIRNSLSYRNAKKDGYEVLYCSNDESKDRVFGIVNIVLVKEVNIKSSNEHINIDSSYTSFKPLKFIVSAAYIKGNSKTKYTEIKQEDIVIDNNLLV